MLTERSEKPPSPIDWQLVKTHVIELTEPREVPGPIKHRGEAKTWGELWDLSLVQEKTLSLSTGDQARTRTYVLDIIDKALYLELPKCRWYQMNDCQK